MSSPQWNHPWPPVHHGAVSGPQHVPNPPLASFGLRLLARTIDYVLVAVTAFVFFFVMIVVVMILSGTSEFSEAATNVWVLLFFFGWGTLIFFYDWLYLAAWGRTLGKMIVGIKVVALADGSKLTQSQALGRSALFGMPQTLPIVGNLFAFGESLAMLGESKQALHDRGAGTKVVRTRWNPRKALPR